MHRSTRERGFSLLEMVVAVAVLAIVAAIAVPNTMEAIYDMRLRSAASDVAGLMQQARIRAIRNNTFYGVKSKVVSGVTLFYVDTSSVLPPTYNNRVTSIVYSSKYPSVQLGGGVVTTFVNADSSGASKPWGFTPLSPIRLSSGVNVWALWGPLGVPCGMSGSVCKNTVSSGLSGSQTAAYQVFLTDKRPFGKPGNLSVTVTPAGRVHVWRWNGTAWQ